MLDLVIRYATPGKRVEQKTFGTVMDFLEAEEKETPPIPHNAEIMSAVFFENLHNVKTKLSLEELVQHCKNILK